MKKGDIGMDKHFSKEYGNKGWVFVTQYLQSEQHLCSIRMPGSARYYIPTSLPQE